MWHNEVVLDCVNPAYNNYLYVPYVIHSCNNLPLKTNNKNNKTKQNKKMYDLILTIKKSTYHLSLKKASKRQIYQKSL